MFMVRAPLGARALHYFALLFPWGGFGGGGGFGGANIVLDAPLLTSSPNLQDALDATLCFFL